MNTRTVRVFATFTFAALATGCSTMHFKNGNTPASANTQSEWHHNIASAFYELSSPVDMQSRCKEKSWSKVTTVLSPINVLAGVAVDTIVAGAPLWSPSTVEYSCGK